MLFCMKGSVGRTIQIVYFVKKSGSFDLSSLVVESALLFLLLLFDTWHTNK